MKIYLYPCHSLVVLGLLFPIIWLCHESLLAVCAGTLWCSVWGIFWDCFAVFYLLFRYLFVNSINKRYNAIGKHIGCNIITDNLLKCSGQIPLRSLFKMFLNNWLVILVDNINNVIDKFLSIFIIIVIRIYWIVIHYIIIYRFTYLCVYYSARMSVHIFQAHLIWLCQSYFGSYILLLLPFYSSHPDIRYWCAYTKGAHVEGVCEGSII